MKDFDAAFDTGPALILVVDDDATKRYVLATGLRRAGHTVVEAATGTDALALVDGSGPRPDIAVVDVRLPDMSGFEVCEQIKSAPGSAGLPVIHVSASAVSAGDRTQGLNRGADAYLTEPLTPTELVATVSATLRYARARRRAEKLAHRLDELNRATSALYEARNARDLAQAAALGASRIFGAPAAALLTDLAGRPGHACSTACGTPDDRPVPEPVLEEILHDRFPAGSATVHHLDAALWPERPACLSPFTELLVTVARPKAARPPLSIALPAEALTADDHDLLAQLTQTFARALEALRSYDEEHTLALTLQRTFLPQTLPTTPRAALAVRYLPASATAEIGGDFYEALATDAGLLVAVGDVAGHSLDAAVVMGELRHALRAYALEGHPPQVVLERLDFLLSRSEPLSAATLCVLLIGEDGAVQFANAGHLPPVVRTPDGAVTLVHEHGPLLGLNLRQPPPVTLTLEPGTDIVLATDGLLERRGTDLAVSLADLEQAMAKAPHDPGDVCDFLLDRFPPDGEDDVALMAIRLT
ncbi:SpoIIE family protein phosphatase [Streptomyces sp. NPDC060194]|uniref:SpoIIE family protein phosphatase n=1 Tax=Streptomyces sp. NPDC060194 TaxID=3347069 RepID=UPI0036552B8A